MAKRTKHRSHSRALVRVPTVKPIVIRSTKIVKAKKHHGKHHHKGLLSGIQTKQVIGGAALGFLKSIVKKNFPNFTVPMVGENGAIALAAYVMRGKVPFADDVMNAALTVVGYQFGAGQTIDGDYIAGC